MCKPRCILGLIASAVFALPAVEGTATAKRPNIRRRSTRTAVALALLSAIGWAANAAENRPNIILVMADDMGWGQTSYNGHPILKTPNLDAMAASGLRFDRFYAGAPVCSPTRASVLTGRANDRTGVPAHGYALRLQEKTIAQALRSAGYATAHFGKWHLNGLRGPGVPVLASDERHPGKFGFDEWLATTNFFDQDPLLSRGGKIEEFKGDSSEVVVDEALKFVDRQRGGGKPFFAVIWYGTPHSPFRALPADKVAFASLNAGSADHYGELVAMDRSIGTLRRRLRDLGIADNTLVVFCSDNGGLPNIEPETVGGLRGFKGSVYEGGLRVPAIIEWPAMIKSPRVTRYPASTMDLFPTIADLVGLPRSSFVEPVDGESLKPLLTREPGRRAKPIPFRYEGKGALVDNRYKLVSESLAGGKFELFDLETDPKESRDISAAQPGIAQRMREQLLAWNATVNASVAGKDYPEGKVTPADPEPVFWSQTAAYRPYLAEWSKRWEYETAAKAPAKRAKKKKK
jgi:arylsulfatase A-like enzyme